MVDPKHLQTMREYTVRLAKALRVKGLMNVQYAMKDDIVYVLEVNPRASRTIPYVSKAIGVPLAKLATKVILGHTLPELGFTQEVSPKCHFVKEVALPFRSFPTVDPLLGPEMRSTGEVMGIARDFGWAYAKAQMAVNASLPLAGTAFLSVVDTDKENLVPVARGFSELGFRLVATRGTARYLAARGLEVKPVLKVGEGRPNVVDHILNGEIQLIVNTPTGKTPFQDRGPIRRAAVRHSVPLLTTLSGAHAALDAIRALRSNQIEVMALQDLHGGGNPS